MWTVSTEGEEIARLRPSYPNVEEDEWEEVVRTSAKILGQCPHPDSPPGTRRTGLAIGKIQSGKTLSYTALIALGVDNGYRVSVVLAGTKNPLRQQSFDRLKHDLTYGRWSVAMLENPTAGDLGTLRQILQSGRHALIIVLKHRGRIDNLTELLSAPEVRRAPTLVIDDEGDEAGLNNQFRRGRRSAIYSSILDLRDALDVHAYLPAGTALALTMQLPAWYVGNNVPDTWIWGGSMDYLEINYQPAPNYVNYVSDILCLGGIHCFLPSQNLIWTGLATS